MAADARDRREHLAYLDGLRGLAIFGVVAFHAVGTSGPWFAPDAGRIGAHGVDLFFVLSGYCLSLRAFARDREPATIRAHVRFVVARFARVAPAYYVALAAFVALSFGPFGFPSVVAAPHAGSPDAWWEALRDAAFLTSAAPSYDASFWSLGFEMRWYLLCPLLIALYLRSRTAFALVALALYAIYISPWTLGDAGSLPCFMLGIVAASRARAHGPFERVAPLLAIVVGALACVRQAFDPNVDHGDPLWHAACFLVAIVASRARVRDALAWKPLRALGVASYSVYLVHQPLLVWLATHGFSRVFAAVASVAVGCAFWFVVERPLGGAFRARLQSAVLAPAERIASIAKRLRRDEPIVVRESGLVSRTAATKSS